MPGDFHVIYGSMVGENYTLPTSTEACLEWVAVDK